MAVRKAYGKLGMTEAFIYRINQTAPENMWYPDADALFQHGVLTQAQGEAVPRMPGPFTKL
ncbi:hypothetical protein [Massilia sp. Se16.2.3]|uniref:hypothetical protein n=1 Tax=Massilia sp. Se16.2.3 TaxID=2709303 RepID=UPI001603D8BA|nr:hypothetical protein [Massilia sp. Se16.2.3]QNA99564.1 hypothetical protein G4G31_13205 [Massilia sp. Se16.2.3]